MKSLHIHNEYPYLNNLTADIRTLGLTPILSPFSQHTSASRLEMFSKHTSQALVINKSDFPRIFTGYEHEFGKYTFDEFLFDQDVTVVDIIPKFSSHDIKGAYPPCAYLIYIGLKDNKVGYVTIDTYFKGTDGYGYKNKIGNISQYGPGSVISENTRLVSSPSKKGERLCYGVNANVCYMTHPSVAEDGYVISQSLADKLESVAVCKSVINVYPNCVPINWYGTDMNNIQFLPNIGEYVKDGILCAFRPISKDMYAADTDPHSLQELNILTDQYVVVEDNAQVIDIEYYTSTTGGRPNPLFAQMEAYRNADIKLYQKIYEIYTQLKRDNYEFRPEFETLVTKAIHRQKAYHSFKKNYQINGEKSSPVEHVQIIVHYTYPRTAEPGFKLTDRYGAKGVISKILPDEDMPCDKFGRRADVITDPGSVVKRLNCSQAYEPGINYISDMVLRTARTMNDEEAFNYILSWVEEVNFNYANLVRRTVKTRIREYLNECFEHGITLHIPPFLESVTGDDNILRWADKFNIEFSPVTFATTTFDPVTGEEIKKIEQSREDVVIGAKYMMLLNKTTHATAVSAAKVNHFGIPVKPFSHNKYDSILSKTPIRLGEDEVRIMCMEVPAEEVVRLINLHANSPSGTQLAIETLMTSKHPTAIGRMKVTNEDLLNSSATVSIYHHLMSFLGIDSINIECDFTLPSSLTTLVSEPSSPKRKKVKAKKVSENDLDEIIGEKSNDEDSDESGESDLDDSDNDDDDSDDTDSESDEDADSQDDENVSDDEDLNDEDN